MRFHSFPGRFTKMQMKLQKENIHLALGIFSPGWAQTCKGCEGWDPQPQCWAGPHLDVLYHDVVSKALRLQVSFDVFQFGEGTLMSTGRLGLAGPRQEVHLDHEGEKETIGTCVTHPAGTQRSVFSYTAERARFQNETLKADRKDGDKQNPQVMEFPSVTLKHLCLPASLTPCNFTQMQRAHNSFLKVRQLIIWDIHMVKNIREKETSLSQAPEG